MRLVMDSSSGATLDRIAQIKREAGDALLGNAMNFLDVGDVFGNPDLGDEYRSPIHTTVPTLFFSGTLDSSCPPFQADEVRKYFRNSVHIVVGNAGHEDMVTNAQVQQVVVEFFSGRDVSKQKIELPPLRFLPIPEIRVGAQVR
jgi:pimeloyl-ACP methyl ester carboxylesterase